MTWTCIPQTFDVPGVLSAAAGCVWTCPDRSLSVWIEGSSAILAEAGTLPGLSVGGTAFSLADTLYSGRAHFFGASGGVVFYSLLRSAWIYRADSTVPLEPVAQVDPDTSAVTGDAWFESASFDPSPFTGASTTFAAQGTATGTATVAPFWPRWTGTSSSTDGLAPFRGTFTAADGATPSTVTLGAPTWRRILGTALGPYFQHRSGGSWKAPATGAEIVAASTLFPDDTSGDYVFTDDTSLRLRSLPSDSTARATIYRLEGESYVSAGRLQGGIPAIVLLPPADAPLVASPALWT